MTLRETLKEWFGRTPTVYHINSISDRRNFDEKKPTRTYRGHNIYIFGGSYSKSIYKTWSGGSVYWGNTPYGDGIYVISLDKDGTYDQLYWVPNRQWQQGEDFRKEGVQKAITMTEKYIDNQISWLESMRKQDADRKANEAKLIEPFRQSGKQGSG